MLAPVSSGSAVDFDRALNLLNIMLDPEAVAKRLEEIRMAEQNANNAVAIANAASGALEQSRQLFEADKAERIRNLDAREGELAAQENELNRQKADFQRDKDAWVMTDAALKDDRKKLDAEVAAHKAKVTADNDALFASNAALDARVKATEAKEEALNARELELLDRETAHDASVKALARALGSVAKEG